MVSFSQLPAVKRDTILGAARKIFGPSYFVTALVVFLKTILKTILKLGGGNLLRQAPKSLDSIGGGNILRQLDSIGGGNILRGASDHNVPRYHGYFEKRGYDPMR